MSQAYDLFTAALKNKSTYTGTAYNAAIRLFMRDQHLSDYEDLLRGDDRQKEDAIISYIQRKNYATANMAVSALRKFYAANRGTLNWDHILLFMPLPPDREEKYLPYTTEQVSAAVAEADIREKTAMLCMASGGPRVGALEGIRIDKDLIFIPKYDLYACILYPGSTSEYMTFFSPQCTQFIDEYRGRRSKGFLFVNKFEHDLPVTRDALYEAIRRALEKANLISETLQPDHSFRKFFRSQLTNAGIKMAEAKLLMGHDIDALRKVYDIHNPLEHLENTGYFKAIQNLTV